VVFQTWICDPDDGGHVIRTTTSEPSEEGSYDRLRDDDFVVGSAAFEVKEFETYWLCGEDAKEMVCCHSVFTDEAFQNVEAFGSEHVDTPLLEQVGGSVCGVFDEAGIHEVLAHGLCHIASHGEGGSSGSSNDSRWISGIRPSIGLREFQ